MEDLKEILGRLSKLIPAQSGISISPRSWLEFLGTELGCDWATYWKVNHKTHLLFPAAKWHSARVHATDLEKTTEKPLGMSEGNAGLVWRSQKPIWATDLAVEMCVPRSHSAQAAGLSAGIWFALKTDQKIFGVMELLRPSLPARTPELLEMIETVGTLIGKQLAAPAENRTGKRNL
jgi:hypothetical protein